MITFNQWGEFLGTRFLGEQVRKEIEKAFAVESPVKLDFQGVRGLSHSFADECFGDLVARMGLSAFKSSLHFLNLSEERKAVLRFVLADRMAHQPT
jgi:hypothetical protein